MPLTINWQPWRDGVPYDSDRPIFLSLVAAWSEACAAMDQATLADPDVAGVVNARYIPVRVDADRRPDLNERYNLGGWPTIALLTPDGHVLNGATFIDSGALITLLEQTADAWRDRREEIEKKIASSGVRPPSASPRPGPSTPLRPSQPGQITSWFRSLLLDEFDAEHGGFGSSVKSPHTPAMHFIVASSENDDTLRQIGEITLGAIDALRDRDAGGYFRYAEGADWSAPVPEKTIEDNAALLEVYLDAAIRWESADYAERAGELARWIKQALEAPDADHYVNQDAQCVSALLRAAAYFNDPWLRDFALQELENTILAGYVPGGGVAHVGRVQSDPPIRDLLCDQIYSATALIWAHQITGQLPYSMLAAELMQFAIRSMWDEGAGCFRDRADARLPLWPLALNCDAARTLDRLAAMTSDKTYREKAEAILRTFAAHYQEHGIFAAPYALAVREVSGGERPPGLNLSHVDWHLDKD